MVKSARKATLCVRMDLGHDKSRMNVDVDRLSSLPDELIHKVLSFISIQEAIGLSVLSSKWKLIWTSIPYLNFQDFDTSQHFSKFVSNFLSRRNNQTQVHSVKLLPGLTFCDESVERVLNYAFTHNVQQLRASFCAYSFMIMTPTWDLPDLTTLHLDGIKLCDDNTKKCIGILSKCPNLMNLSLGRYKVKRTNVLKICHPRLSNLTLGPRHCKRLEAVKVVAPQLKNLTINGYNQKLLISAPGLTSLAMTIDVPLHISTEGFLSLEKANLCIYHPRLANAHKIVYLLQQLYNVKFLTLNLKILEVLSSSMKHISHQPSPFSNLKILSFSTTYPGIVCLEVRAHEKEAVSTETDKYLLDSSSSSIFTMVSCEEIKVMRKIISAQGTMKELRASLGHNGKMHEHGKLQVKESIAQSPLEMISHFGEMIAQIRQRTKKAPKSDTWLQPVISLLQYIEGLVTELPASKRDVMQATFASLCEDAAILLIDIL